MTGDDDAFEMLEESAHSSRRWMDLEAAELHAARARVERLKRRSVSSSPPRERRRPGDPSDGDAPPGLGGETWFRRRASRAADDEDDAFPSHASSDLRRRGDIPGPPLVGKVTARSYEVDRRGESRDAARRERERRAARPRPPGDAHALRPTVTAKSREVEPVPPSFSPQEELKAPAKVAVPAVPAKAQQTVEAAPTKPATPVRGETAPPSPRPARPPPTPFRARSEGVTFVWSGSDSTPPPDENADENADEKRETRAERDAQEDERPRDDARRAERGRKGEGCETKTRTKIPNSVFARRWGAGAAAAFGSGALRLRGGAFALHRSVGTAASATRAAAARVAGSTRAAAASAGASARRGAGAACARGAASVRDTLVFVKEAAHAEEVLGGVRAALTSTKAFLLENPDVTWNARVPPLLAARAGAARGLGWFKVLEGDQPLDARGPGDAPSVRAEATPRRSRLTDCAADRAPGVTVAACGGRFFSAAFPARRRDPDDGSGADDDDETRRALFENFEGYGSLGADFAATAAAAAAAVAADAERLERALREADWTAPLSPLPPRAEKRSETSEVVFHPALTPKRKGGKVDARALRVEDYEESLATRVRTLQRMFPEVASEIAGAVYAFQEDVAANAKGAPPASFAEPGAPRVKSTLAAKGMTRVPVDVRAATRVVEELEAASVSVLMHGKVPTGASMRRWLGELKAGRGMGREAWRDEHGAFYGPGAAGENVTSPQESLGSQTEGSGSGSYGGWDAVAAAAAAAGAPAAAAPSYAKATPRSRAATSRLAGAFAGWTGRAADDDAFLSVSDDAGSAEAAKATNATHAVGAFRAWREVSSTGPIRKATLDTVHRMRADANAETNANAMTTRRAAPFDVGALADRTNVDTRDSSGKKKPSPPRRFFNLVASPFARRRRGDSPHSDWGSSGSDFESEGVSTGAAARRTEAGSASRGRSSPSSDSSDVWMSAGAAMSTPGSVASGAVASRPPASPRFESARSRGARASATPTVYFPCLAFLGRLLLRRDRARRRASAGVTRHPRVALERGFRGREPRRARPRGGLRSCSTTPSPPAPWARCCANRRRTLARFPSRTPPCTRCRRRPRWWERGAATRATLSAPRPRARPEASDGPLTSSGVSRKRSSPPGSRANKHAAAAAVGAPAWLRHRRARGV
jgi:hypothetical protein